MDKQNTFKPYADMTEHLSAPNIRENLNAPRHFLFLLKSCFAVASMNIFELTKRNCNIEKRAIN